MRTDQSKFKRLRKSKRCSEQFGHSNKYIGNNEDSRKFEKEVKDVIKEISHKKAPSEEKYASQVGDRIKHYSDRFTYKNRMSMDDIKKLLKSVDDHENSLKKKSKSRRSSTSLKPPRKISCKTVMNQCNEISRKSTTFEAPRRVTRRSVSNPVNIDRSISGLSLAENQKYDKSNKEVSANENNKREGLYFRWHFKP